MPGVLHTGHSVFSLSKHEYLSENETKSKNISTQQSGALEGWFKKKKKLAGQFKMIEEKVKQSLQTVPLK